LEHEIAPFKECGVSWKCVVVALDWKADIRYFDKAFWAKISIKGK